MVSAETLQTVTATAPILAEQGELLTRHFYDRMFRENPEVKPFFNPAHQVSGKQQKALAAAITSYATHLGEPEKLADAVALIAHKHGSLGVLPEHYPIVGANLLAAIQEVLDIPAEHPVVVAWGEAYQALAELMIAQEEALYQERDREHGSRGFAPFSVQRKVVESETITSFYLTPKPGTGRRLGAYLPGQYLTLRLPTAAGSTTMRNYSLSGPCHEQHYRISVKRETAVVGPCGYASNRLHDHIHEGDSVEVGGPYGVFTWQDAGPVKPLVLLSAGVGITPILAILHAATAETARPRDILFIHATQHSGVHAFRDEVAAIAERYPRLRVRTCYDTPRPGDADLADVIGRVDSLPLAKLIPDRDVDAYFCGPMPFMIHARGLLTDLGVSTDQQHYECFGPLESLDTAPSGCPV